MHMYSRVRRQWASQQQKGKQWDNKQGSSQHAAGCLSQYVVQQQVNVPSHATVDPPDVRLKIMSMLNLRVTIDRE